MKALDLAMERVRELPETAQEQIGRSILFQIKELDQLRTDLKLGIDQLDEGEGRVLDIEDVIRHAHREHGIA